MLPVAAFPSTPLVESTVLSTLFSPWVYNKNAVICIPEDYPMSGVTLHCQDRLINLSIVTERCFLRGNIKITKIIFLSKKLQFQIHYLSHEAGHFLFLVYSLASFHVFEAGCFGNLIYRVMWAVCPHKLVHFLYLFNWRLREKNLLWRCNIEQYSNWR